MGKKEDHESFTSNAFCFKGIQEKGLKEDQLKDYEESKYKMKTIIPTRPYHVYSYELTQQQLDEFLSNYSEYAEFLISLRKI